MRVGDVSGGCLGHLINPADVDKLLLRIVGNPFRKFSFLGDAVRRVRASRQLFQASVLCGDSFFL